MKEDDRLIFLLRQARHHLMTNLDRSLLENSGITTAQSGVLFHLILNNGCLLKELSRELELDNSAITGIVDRLENKNFVERRHSKSDRRAINIHLTQTGNEAGIKALAVVRKYNETVKEGFSPREIDVFKRVLESVIDRFGKEKKTRGD